MRVLLALLLSMLCVITYAQEWPSSSVVPDNEQDSRRSLIFRLGEHEKMYKAEAAYPLPRCDGMSEDGMRLCLLVREARRIARETPLALYHPKGSKEVWREFVLVAFDEKEHRFHSVILEMPVAPQAGLRSRNKTTGYEFERLRGTSLSQMTFRIWFEGRELRVFGAKYIVIPKEAWGAPLPVVRLYAEEVSYLATPSHLNTPEFCAMGMDLAKERLVDVLENLRQKRVPSLSSPNKLLADTVHPLDLLALIGIEQSGEEELFGERMVNFANGKHNLREFCRVYSTYMLNGLIAFRYVCSGAPACGPFQFTDMPGSQTYSTVRKRYPLADLDPKFARGTGTFHNAAVAAALLLDLERTNARVAGLLRDLRTTDPLLEVFFPIAAYNGGASQATHLATLYAKYRKEYGKEMRSSVMPWEWKPFADPAMRSRSVPGEFFPQTVRYIRKYQLASDMLVRVYGAQNPSEGVRLVLAGQ